MRNSLGLDFLSISTVHVMSVSLYVFPKTVELLAAYLVETYSIDGNGYLIARLPVEAFPFIANLFEQSGLFHIICIG